MSSARIAVLKIDATGAHHYDDAGLWTRGGFSDVRVCHDNREYLIPEAVLWDLFREELSRARINSAEQMTTAEAMASVGINPPKSVKERQ